MMKKSLIIVATIFLLSFQSLSQGKELKVLGNYITMTDTATNTTQWSFPLIAVMPFYIDSTEVGFYDIYRYRLIPKSERNYEISSLVGESGAPFQFSSITQFIRSAGATTANEVLGLDYSNNLQDILHGIQGDDLIASPLPEMATGTYSVTSGQLPSYLSLNPTTGNITWSGVAEDAGIFNIEITLTGSGIYEGSASDNVTLTVRPTSFDTILHDTNLQAVNYTQNGTSFTFTGGNATCSGGQSSLFNNWIYWNGDLSLNSHERYIQTIEVTTPILFSSSTNGPGLGIKSVKPSDGFDNTNRFALDTSPTEGSRITMYDNGNFVSNRLIADDPYNLSQATRYFFELERNVDVYTSRVYNNSGTLIYELSQRPTNADSTLGYDAAYSWQYSNTGRYTIQNFGGSSPSGSFTIHSYTVQVPGGAYSAMNPRYLWIGDSNTQGFGVKFKDRFADLVMKDPSSTHDSTFHHVLAAGGNVIGDMSDMSTLIDSINATYVIACIGTNDIRLSNASINADFDALADFIRNNTDSELIIMSPPALDGSSVASYRDHQQSYATTNSVTFVDLYEATRTSGGTALDNAFDLGDGIHLNEAGHSLAKDLLIQLGVF